MESRYYWLKVTQDKYELPLVVAENRQELADMCGIKLNSLDHTISVCKKKGYKSGYVRVLKEEFGIVGGKNGNSKNKKGKK